MQWQLGQAHLTGVVIGNLADRIIFPRLPDPVNRSSCVDVEVVDSLPPAKLFRASRQRQCYNFAGYDGGARSRVDRRRSGEDE
jgi:hypothetical protein